MDFHFPFLLSLLPYAISLIFLLIFLEQLSYLKKKRHVPGPSFIPLPFFGSATSLIRNPTSFWDDQSRFAKSSPLGFSANYIVGRFILFIRSSDLSHKIFSNVRKDAFHLVGHPFGKKLFGEHNLIYMLGDEHKDLRRRIAPNFSPKALSTYTELQQRVVIKHLMAWRDLSSGTSPNPIKLRLLVRDMNLETSQTVFVGPYLGREAREKFKADYNLFNVGLMKLPFDFPGSAFRAARLAVSRLVKTLAACADDSKSRMSAPEAEPTCLIDFWMQETIREESEKVLKEDSDSSPLQPSSSFPPPTSEAVGGHLFDFLFAAQDASTSSLLWAVTFLDSHPEVLSRVREEVAAVWTPESDAPITGEQLSSLRFTEAVAREVVRIRPPATLVPHIAGVDFPLTETYTIPKGTIVFPSVYESSFQGFPEAEKFDPDRFYDEGRAEDRVYKRNYLAFGTGPHQCVGQRYAIRHLVLFIAMFVSLFDFKRVRTDGCDDITYVPTICPRDDCTVVLSATCKKFPSFVK